jgi:hypothetical protein
MVNSTISKQTEQTSMKRCRICNTHKPPSDFNIRASNKDRLDTRCKACQCQSTKDWQNKNRERFKASIRARYAKNKERHKEVYSRYKQNNPTRFASIICNIASRYRAKKKSAQPAWLTTNHLNQIKLFYDCSAYCSSLGQVKFHVDHIIPLQGELVSGLHVPWNLQVLSESENTAKSNHF